MNFSFFHVFFSLKSMKKISEQSNWKSKNQISEYIKSIFSVKRNFLILSFSFFFFFFFFFLLLVHLTWKVFKTHWTESKTKKMMKNLRKYKKMRKKIFEYMKDSNYKIFFHFHFPCYSFVSFWGKSLTKKKLNKKIYEK